MKKLNKREKILAIGVGILLLLFMLKLMIFNPTMDKLNSVRADIERLQLAVRKFQSIEQQKETILEEQKRIEKYMNLKGSEQEKLAAILSKIEQQARQAGLSILDINPGNIAGTKPTVFNVQLRAEADLEQILDFVYNIENSDILFKVERLNLSAKEETGKTLKMDANILGISLS